VELARAYNYVVQTEAPHDPSRVRVSYVAHSEPRHNNHWRSFVPWVPLFY
jgi:hypothetical protein